MGDVALNDLISSVGDAIENIGTLYKYCQSDDLNERKFHDIMITSGKCFVVVESPLGYRFAPSKFAGYVENDLLHKYKQRDGRKTNKKIIELAGKLLTSQDDGYQKIDDNFLVYCSENGIAPRKVHNGRRYWLLKMESSFSTPDEIIEDELWEGAKTTIKVNRFERNTGARGICLKHYGYDCSVCGVNLEDVYGELANNFIHVHHIVPLSAIGEKYQVDPIHDLRPVCPNCHAILHLPKEVLSIDELKVLLSTASKKR